MMSPLQAFAIEQLQDRLKISDGQLLAFAQQFTAGDDCRVGLDQFTLDLMSFEQTAEVIRQLRLIESLEEIRICEADELELACSL
jgi:hypothetical protein